MKRVGNLFEKIVDSENIILGELKALRGKSGGYGVIKHLSNRDDNLSKLREDLINKRFTTSEYKVFTIFDGKEREISKLPFYPDRIVHQAVINVLEPIFVNCFTADTYSCIKGRGIHKASFKLRRCLREDVVGTKYCLKMDIRKFYPSIDNEVLKGLLRRKFKDKDLLWLLDGIIDSTKGLPLGSLTSQHLANFYLTYFDHWVKEVLGTKHFFRYCDDIIILASSKKQLWEWFYKIQAYLKDNLKLDVKSNYQVFSVDIRDINWVGYRHFRKYTLIRKSIKTNYIKSKHKKRWKGWFIHCDSKNLIKKYEKVNN